MWKYLEKVWFQVDQNIDTEESKKKKWLEEGRIDFANLIIYNF